MPWAGHYSPARSSACSNLPISFIPTPELRPSRTASWWTCEAGFKLPVAITRAAWARYVEVPAGLEMRGQSVEGRLWDVLFMLHVAIQRESGSGSEIHYQLHVALLDAGDWQTNEAVPDERSGLTRSTHRLVTLKALCGPGDNLEPVVTIMLPSED